MGKRRSAKPWTKLLHTENKKREPSTSERFDGFHTRLDCELGEMLANANLALAGAPLKRLHDSLGFYLAKPLCENGRRTPWRLV